MARRRNKNEGGKYNQSRRENQESKPDVIEGEYTVVSENESAPNEKEVENAKKEEGKKDEKIKDLKESIYGFLKKEGEGWAQDTKEVAIGTGAVIGSGALGGVSGIYKTLKGVFLTLKDNFLSGAGNILPDVLISSAKRGRDAVRGLFKDQGGKDKK